MGRIFKVGEVIKSKYLIKELVEQGKAEATYICKYRKNYSLMKQIFVPEENQKDREELFLRRCEALKELDHDNLLKIEDFFIEDGSSFIVIEDIKGKTLHELYKEEYKKSFFPSDLLMKYMLKVCQGVLYMHEKAPPVLYGNLSPRTVLIEARGDVKLIDYGLKNIIRFGGNKGQKGYSSPEQANGKGTYIKSDVYSIGAVMYRLLGGKFSKDKKNARSLRKNNRQVSRQLDDLIMRCLSRKSSKRPALEELYQDLSKLYLSETLRKATRIKFAGPGGEEKEITQSQEEENGEEKVVKLRLKKKKKKQENGKEKAGKKIEEEDIPQNEIEEKKDDDLKRKKSRRRVRLTGTTKRMSRESAEEELEETVSEVEEVLEGSAGEMEAKPVVEDLEDDLKIKKSKRRGKFTSVTNRMSRESVNEELEEIEEEVEVEEIDEEKLAVTAKTNRMSRMTADKILDKDEEKKNGETRRTGKTTMMKRLIIEAIKQKEQENGGKEEKEQEKELDKDDEKEKTGKNALKEPEVLKKSQGNIISSISTRSASIARFLKEKSGLSDESYELDMDLLTGKKKKPNLSDRFLAGLKIVPLPSARSEKVKKIKKSRFLPYKKPESPSPLPLYEEIDMLKDNRYEVGELLHKDCFGAVYKVRDYDEEDKNKEIKVLKEIQYTAKEPEVIRRMIHRFNSVCKLLLGLENSSLVRLYDYFHVLSDDGLSIRLCFITEYVEGISLLEFSEFPSPENEDCENRERVLDIVLSLTKTIQYLHNKRVPYGDLRPSNIILAEDGSIKCLNFGLCKIFQDIDSDIYPGKGTYGYVAPELKSLTEADIRSDIFSLGIIIYYLFTGVNPGEMSYKFKPMRKFNSSISNQGERFVNIFLNFTPSSRPDINQINRVIDRVNFFEDKKASSSFKEEEDLEMEEFYIQYSGEGFLEKFMPVAKKVFLPLIIVLAILWIMFYFKTAQNASKLNDMGYAIDMDGEKIYKIGLEDFKVKGFLEAGQVLGGPVLSSDNRYLYFTRFDNKLVVIDLMSGKEAAFVLLKSEPVELVVSPGGDKIFSVNKGDDTVSIVDTSSWKVIDNVSTGKEPSDLVLSPNGKELYVCNYESNNISLIDLDSKKSTFISVEEGPVALDVTPDGKNLYVVCSSANSIYVMDLVNLTHKATIPLEASSPKDILCSPDGSLVYISYKAVQEISIISTVTNNLAGNIPVKRTVSSMSLSRRNNNIYVCSPQSMSGGKPDNRILIYDLNDNIRIAETEYPQLFTKIVLPGKVEEKDN